MAASLLHERLSAAAPSTLSDPLELLAMMGQDFAQSHDINATLVRAVTVITWHLGAEGGACFLLDEGGETLTCTCSCGASEITGIQLRRDQGIVGRCVENNRGEFVRDVSQDPGFYDGVDAKTGLKTRSILCAPMSVQDRCVGAIELINKRGADPHFTADDLHILETMAASAALAILNAEMAQALIEQERVRRELELAAEIQRRLLPDPGPESFPVHGLNLPARVVSGDFYDFFALPDGCICFNLGDVAGKGMNAALLMAKTASLYRCLGKTIHSPGRLLERINDEICETATRGMFVTMVGGIYDPSVGTVRLANAGHEPPLLANASGAMTNVPAEAPPLGVTPTALIEGGIPETLLHLDGGTLYIFSDGVTEGYVRGGGTLGVDGFSLAIAAARDRPLPARLQAVADMFRIDGTSLRDDVTILAVSDAEAAGQRNSPAPLRAPEDESETILVLSVPTRADRLKLLRQGVRAAATFCGMNETDVNDVILAIDEACQNVIRHAYHGDPDGTMILEVRRREGAMIVYLRDFAQTVDVETIRPRALHDVRPGGLGVTLMNSVMDEVKFLTPMEDGGNLLRMVKHIGG